MDTTFIYILRDPISKKIRYIGKANDPKKRYNSHICLKSGKGRHLWNWILMLKKKGFMPILEVIEEVNKNEWKIFEKYYIKKYRENGNKLVNLTNGGEGSDGYRHTNEVKKEMRLNHKDVSGKKNPNYGKLGLLSPNYGRKNTEETKNKMSMAQRGNKNHNYGKRMNNLVRKKISKKLGTKIIINKIEYDSIRQASRELNIPRSTLIYKIKNGSWTSLI